MNNKKYIGNYLILKSLFPETLGPTFRVGLVEAGRIKKHYVLTEVDPVFYRDPENWKKIQILLEGIRKSNIVSIYSPGQILRLENKYFLLYNLIDGRNFEQVMRDVDKRGLTVNFDLAFSIALAVADILESASSIVVSGEKSFHGFLTPDNIILHNDGKISLKNYGLIPYLQKDEQIASYLLNNYGAYLSPEEIRREKVSAQSDIYHLGFLVYKMLTGSYFVYSEDDDFDRKFDSVKFRSSVSTGDKTALDNLIQFFKKTLHPDPKKRFLSIREFRDFVSEKFHLEELSSVLFNLAYFMDNLYADQNRVEEAELKAELEMKIEEERRETNGGELVSTILASLEEEKKSSKKWLWITSGALVVIVIVFLIVYQSQLARKEKEKEDILKKQQEYSQRIKEMEEQLMKEKELFAQRQKEMTEAEKKAAEEKALKLQQELEKIRKQQEAELKRKQEEEERLKAEAEAKAKQEEEERMRLEEEKRLREEEEKRRQEELRKIEASKIKEGQLIAYADLDQKPQKISGDKPVPTKILVTKYKRPQITKFDVIVTLLIDQNGNVESVKFIGSYPEDIQEFLIESLKKWKYSPALKDGVKVKVWLPPQRVVIEI